MDGTQRREQGVAGRGRGASPTLRGRLLLLVAAVALPLCVLVGLSGWLVQRAATDRARDALLGQARALAAAVDAEFAIGLASLRVVAVSDSLARGDLDAVERNLRAVTATSGGVMGLHGREGRFLLATVWPPGERRDAPSSDPIRQAFATRRLVITNLVTPTQGAGGPVFGMALPVTLGAEPEPRYVVTLAIPRERMRVLVAAPAFGESGYAAILDREVRLVARTGDDAALVGSYTPGVLAEAARGAFEGTLPGTVRNPDGIPVVAAFARAPLSGYVAAVSISESSFRAPLTAALLQVLPIGVAVGLAGIGTAFVLGRRLTAAIRKLAALGRGEHPPPAGLREVDDVTAALTHEAEERREAERRQSLLMAELNHRVKNVLASVQSVASQTIRGAEGDFKRFETDFGVRLRSLAAAHDLLTQRAWAGAEASEIMRAALAPWLPGGRLALTGADDFTLSPAQAQSLVLALNELAMNAVKHGALSVPEGRVGLHRAIGADGAAGLTWIETGGPPVARIPARRGFGLRLLQSGLARDLGRGAEVALDFAPTGLIARIRFTPAG